MMKKAFRSIPILGVPTLMRRPARSCVLEQSRPIPTLKGWQREVPGTTRGGSINRRIPTRKGWNRIVASLFHPFSRVESFASPRDHGVM